MYRVTIGLDTDTIDDSHARLLWDLADDEMRSGSREGAFILWRLNANGWRTIPTLFRPIPPGPIPKEV